MNLVDVLDATVRRRPHHTALKWGDREMTFRELRDAADRAATVFESKNVLPGDRVLVMTYNDPGFVVAMYGLWRMGAVLVPVNHKLTGPELEHIAGHSGAVLGIASEELVEAAREARRASSG